MIKPEATITIYKEVEDHFEELTYTYSNIGKAANVFCDLIKKETDFTKIVVTFNSCPGTGILYQVYSAQSKITIRGPQFKKNNIYYPYCSFLEEPITKEEACTKIKMEALRTLKKVKALEKASQEPQNQ